MIEFWYWWVAAVLLGVAEILAPATIFIWPAGAAALVGCGLLLWPEMDWRFQLLTFSLLSIGSVVGARVLAPRENPEPDTLHLNRRAEQYVGTLHTLETAIVNGRGRAHVGDSHWTVEGPDLPAGSVVRVVGTDGVMLKVEAADPVAPAHH